MTNTMRRSSSARGLRGLALFAIVLVVPIAACSRKMKLEDCNHLLGRGVGLAAYAGSAEVPVDIDALRARARGGPKRAIEDFDKACVGALDDGQIACARRANNVAEFAACGGLVTKARDAGIVAAQLVARRHTSDECSKYAEHGVHAGVGTADDAGKLMRECDEVMEEGVYACRLAAKDAAAWEACMGL